MDRMVYVWDQHFTMAFKALNWTYKERMSKVEYCHDFVVGISIFPSLYHPTDVIVLKLMLFWWLRSASSWKEKKPWKWSGKCRWLGKHNLLRTCECVWERAPNRQRYSEGSSPWLHLHLHVQHLFSLNCHSAIFALAFLHFTVFASNYVVNDAQTLY